MSRVYINKQTQGLKHLCNCGYACCNKCLKDNEMILIYFPEDLLDEKYVRITHRLHVESFIFENHVFIVINGFAADLSCPLSDDDLRDIIDDDICENEDYVFNDVTGTELSINKYAHGKCYSIYDGKNVCDFIAKYVQLFCPVNYEMIDKAKTKNSYKIDSEYRHSGSIHHNYWIDVLRSQVTIMDIFAKKTHKVIDTNHMSERTLNFLDILADPKNKDMIQLLIEKPELIDFIKRVVLVFFACIGVITYGVVVIRT